MSFPNKPSKKWVDERGSQAIFMVMGATEVLASYMNSLLPLKGMKTEHGWEIIVSQLRPDQVLVICEADIKPSEFTRGLRAIAGYFQEVTADVLEHYERERQTRKQAAMAVASPENFAWSGSAGS